MEKDAKSKSKIKDQGSMGPRHMGGGSGEKPKDFKKAMRTLLQYLHPYWISMFFVVLFAITSTVFAIISPRILGDVTNQVVEDVTAMMAYDQIVETLPDPDSIPEGLTADSFINALPDEQKDLIPESVKENIKSLDLTQRPEIDFDSIAETMLLLLGLYILSMILAYSQSFILINVTQDITFKLRKEISQKIHKVPLKYYDDKNFGDVMSRITNDVDTINQNLNQVLGQIIIAVTTVIGVLIMMFSISWIMTVVALFMIPLSMGVTMLVVKKSQKYFTKQQQILGVLNGHIEESFTGHNIVKAFNREEDETAEFQETNDKLYESGWKSQFYSGLLMPIISLFGNIGYVAISVLGGWLAVRGIVNIGDIQAFLQYMRMFNQPLMQVANSASVIQGLAAASERVFEFLDEEIELEDSDNSVDMLETRGEVSFKDVEFSYDGDKNVIENFSAQIEPGQRVAIVGPTGAGKTTMVNLLMRFYDVRNGSIEIDDVDLRDIKRSSLRDLFGMVLQDTWLFNGTIRENLKYGREDATDQEMYEATEATHVDHVIRSLPDGYDMVIDEDAENISQGEKQLLTIARAMLVDPPILILDEATSSVDTRTEMLIQKAMDKLMDGRTTFVIAHRLSTIKDADLILVMNEGNIVEKGTHEQLLEMDGFYAELYNSQFEE